MDVGAHKKIRGYNVISNCPSDYPDRGRGHLDVATAGWEAVMQRLIEVAFDLVLVVRLSEAVLLAGAVVAFGYMVRDLWR